MGGRRRMAPLILKLGIKLEVSGRFHGPDKRPADVIRWLVVSCSWCECWGQQHCLCLRCVQNNYFCCTAHRHQIRSSNYAQHKAQWPLCFNVLQPQSSAFANTNACCLTISKWKNCVEVRATCYAICATRYVLRATCYVICATCYAICATC